MKLHLSDLVPLPGVPSRALGITMIPVIVSVDFSLMLFAVAVMGQVGTARIRAGFWGLIGHRGRAPFWVAVVAGLVATGKFSATLKRSRVFNALIRSGSSCSSKTESVFTCFLLFSQHFFFLFSFFFFGQIPPRS